MRRLLPPALALACALAPTSARAQACFGNIKWARSYKPFAVNPIPGADFPAGYATVVDNTNALTVNGAGQALNTEQIVLPFTQGVQVKMLYAQGKNSGIFGWFYWDQVTSNANFWDPLNNVLVDKDGDGIKDWFQYKTVTRLADGLYLKSVGANPLPDFLTIAPFVPASYADGGLYARVPNVIEGLINVGLGGLAFKLTDDDFDLVSGNGNSTPVLPINPDVSIAVDGIPDYDVNGDGTVGNEADRTANLGSIQGGREIVFFYIALGGDPLLASSGWTVKNSVIGYTGAGTQVTRVVPYFSKSILNPDSYNSGLVANAAITTFDAGCAYPGPCGGKPGWMDAAALTRLNGATYGPVAMPSPTLKAVTVTPQGHTPHFVAAAPVADPNRWIFGVEDAPIGTVGCAGCTTSDKDFNDAIFVVQRAVGGYAQSAIISTDINGADIQNSMITKIRIEANALFPAPCPAPSATTPLNAGSTRIDLQYSVDGGATWYPVVFPAGTSGLKGTAVIDLLSSGISGSQLVWRANFASGIDACTPKLTDVSIGYYGLRKGSYQLTEPLPAANTMLRGQFETPAATWTPASDRQPRGHLTLNQLYDLDPSPQVDYTDPTYGTPPPLLWDAGQVLATRSPDPPPAANGRNVFYNGGVIGTPPQLITGVPAIAQQLLPGSGSCNAGGAGVRCNRSADGRYTYDFNGDGDVNDADADWLLNWSRGWDGGTSKLGNRWMLGGMVRGTPAIITPPPTPWWYDDSMEVGLKTAFVNFQTAWRFRRALALAGSQDGQIHAFDAGQFTWGDDPTSVVVESAGYFRHPSDNKANPRDYGDGSEQWAYVPPGEMNQLKNNHPRANGFVTGQTRASTDAAIGVAEVCLGPPAVPANAVDPFCNFVTVAVAQQTRNHPYVTALNVTNANGKGGGSPSLLWANDWPLNDPANTLAWDEVPQGSESKPTIGPLQLQAGRKFVAVVSSGIASTPMTKLMVYAIDLSTGQTAAKVQVNVNGNGLNCGGTVLGSVGSPVMVDSDRDGIADRLYLADTNGCLYKVNFSKTQPPTVCPIASLGESVFAPIAVRTTTDVVQRAQIFVGGADNPDTFDLSDGTTAPPPDGYHLFAFEDDDATGACGLAQKMFAAPLRPQAANPASIHKLWSAPTFSATSVLVATSVGDQVDPCALDATNNGYLQAWALLPDSQGSYKSVMTPVALNGSAVGGVRVTDGHIFVNTVGPAPNGGGSPASTTILGVQRSWQTGPTLNPRPAFGVPLWLER